MWKVQGMPAAMVCVTTLTLTVPWWSRTVRAGDGVADPQVSGAVAVTGGGGNRWNAFSADVTIARRLRDADHNPVGADVPGIRYRWRRVHEGGRWKTTVEVVSPTRPAVVSSTGSTVVIPPVIARMEDAGDGAGPRFFTRAGALVRLPGDDDRTRLGVPDEVFARTEALVRDAGRVSAGRVHVSDEGQDWIDAVLPSADRKRVRRASLQQRFGSVAGRVRGLDRYLVTSGGDTTEVLADAEWGVPVEVNVMRGGELRDRMTFLYEAGAGGSMVRRHVQTERVMPDANGVRMAVDVDLQNVALGNAVVAGGR